MCHRMMLMTAASAGIIGLAISTPARLSAQSAADTTGPYRVTMEEDPSLPNHTVYRPADLDTVRGTLPIVAFGNGACANAGNAFERYLAEIASHGFLVVANGPISNAALPAGRPGPPGATVGGGRAGTPAAPGAVLGAAPAMAPPGATGEAARGAAPTPPGAGRGDGRGRGGPGSSVDQLYETVDWAHRQHAASASRYRGKLAVDKIAVAGQSCGGLQALEAAGDPRVATAVIFNSGIIRGGGRPGGAPGQPAAPGAEPGRAAGGALAITPAILTKLHTPLIYIIGGPSDIAYANAESDFAEIDKVPVFKANLDVGHNGTLYEPHGGKFAEVATQWFLWQLKGDAKAAALFKGDPCGLCTAPEWKTERKNWK